MPHSVGSRPLRYKVDAKVSDIGRRSQRGKHHQNADLAKKKFANAGSLRHLMEIPSWQPTPHELQASKRGINQFLLLQFVGAQRTG